MPHNTRPTARSRAAALAASVSLLVPGFAAPLAAQTSEDIAAACTAEFGAEGEALANCIDSGGPAIAAETVEPVVPDAADQTQIDADADATLAAEREAAQQAEADEAARIQADAEALAAQEAEARERAEAEEQERLLAETQAAAEAQALADAEAQAVADAEERERLEAEAQAAADAEAQALRDAEAQTAADAEERERLDAEAQAAADAEAQALLDAEAEERARLQALADAEAQAAADDAPVDADAAGVETSDPADTQAVEEPVETLQATDGNTLEETDDTQAAEGQVVVDPLESPETEVTGMTETVPADAAPVGAPVDTAGADEAVTDTTPLVETQTQSALGEEIAARPELELTEEQQTSVSEVAPALGAILGDESAPAATFAAAMANDAGNDPAAGTEVEEETIAAGDMRTAEQEFATQAIVSDNDDDDDRFDRNDKLMMGALAALGVGALLVSNNNRARVVSNSGDRVVLQDESGQLRVLKDDSVLLRQAGSNVRTERFDDGSTRQTVLREDGSRIVTIRDASLRVVRREQIAADGNRYLLIDDTVDFQPVDVSTLPAPIVSSRSAGTTPDPLAAALRQQEQLDRRFSLAQVRNIAEVRALAPAFDVSTVTFASGSAAIAPEQAGNLRGLANEVLASIRANPREVFLVEGHTDAVGDAAYNLALSDRRAESLALALNEYFAVPVENMVVQGYGESFLKVQTQSDEQANRRATVRQITGLLQTAASN